MFYVWRVNSDELMDYRVSVNQPKLVRPGELKGKGVVVSITEEIGVQIVGYALAKGECEVIPKRGSGEPE